jgi:hypothetical protein
VGRPHIVVIHRHDDASIVAIRGRGNYVVEDITPIRQITQAVLESKITPLDSKPSPVQMMGVVSVESSFNINTGSSGRD